MQLMLECCLVSTGTNTALAFVPLGVAASHTGRQVRKTGAFSVYPIAASATFSIASPAGSPHSTRRTASRAVLLSVCHRHGYAELSPLEISRIKGYLVRRVQHGFQPKSQMFPEFFVRHCCIHSCAQAKKISSSRTRPEPSARVGAAPAL